MALRDGQALQFHRTQVNGLPLAGPFRFSSVRRWGIACISL